MKKICVVTATRSEYGILRWLIDEIKNDEQLVLQLVVTGTHLSPQFGLTYKEIEGDGYLIDEKLEILMSSYSEVGVVKTMGICSIGFADILRRNSPHIVVVLGDRYELLPICSAALMMNIPIAHISGGDVTEGAIDDQIRNAITMMATLHFPGVEESAKRIERMRNNSNGIYTVGEPGLDNFNRLKLWSRKVIAGNLLLDIEKDWVLLTYHPETKITLEENLQAISNIVTVLSEIENIEVVITGANSDFGGAQLNEIFKNISNVNQKFKYFDSLGQLRYLSLMKEVAFVIGNSSSGLVEAPFLSKKVINIGNRQKGRYISDNIICTDIEYYSILDSINRMNEINVKFDYYYGDGNASLKIKEYIKEYLLKE